MAVGFAQKFKVLVGLDLTDRSERAFKRAVSIAAAQKAELSILHAVDRDLPSAIADAHSEYATTVLQDHATRARGAGLEDVNQIMMHGQNYEVIVEQAQNANADLIVLGTHQERGYLSDLLGTTVDRVLRTSGKPVLLVRQPSGRSYSRIIVAVDFSVASRRALELAMTLFPVSEMFVVNVFDKRDHSPVNLRQMLEEVIEKHRLALKGFVEEVSLKAGVKRGGTGPVITELIETGLPENVVPELAKDRLADLIVIGTHARSGITRAILGSVAERVMAISSCDVLAVPPHPVTAVKNEGGRDRLMVA